MSCTDLLAMQHEMVGFQQITPIYSPNEMQHIADEFTMQFHLPKSLLEGDHYASSTIYLKAFERMLGITREDHK